ncbi:winged helix-turn-helix transcriptional regulator [Methanogenium organophilum]|uniref:Winged helix-turn-helix transcriptional regulator n=1 Tax=Methanogenium organophilum TaxID=2199 RepID=A0A9X9T8B5_METOG|nr:winged helix-turn-helix transcriptional regulator [Methanogenium organophilum]WAI00987.1 winged helix-turn-helix transcriptional regulator [Methanogenium organophilum]
MSLKGTIITIVAIVIIAYAHQASVNSNIIVTPSADPPDLTREDVVYVVEWWELPLKSHIVSFIGINIPILIPFANLLAILSGAFLGVRQIEKKNILENERRTKIYQEIQKNPGIIATEMETVTGIKRSSLRHHLEILEREGLVISQKITKQRHYFENHHTYSPEYQLARSLLNGETTRDIFSYITAHPGCTQKDLSAYAKVSGPTISWHIDKLRSGNLVTIEKEKNFHHYFPGETAEYFINNYSSG